MKLKVFSSIVLLFLLRGANQAEACGQSTNSISSIPTFGGSGFQVNALNANGQAAGFSYLPGDTAAHAFIYASGFTADIGTLGGAVSDGNAINSSGLVAGYANTTGDMETHAFLYDGSTMHDLGTLGGSFSTAVGVNDAGVVVGTSTTLGDMANEAFVYQNGTMTGLGDLGGGSSEAVAVNNPGTVAGNASTSGFNPHGFIYTNGTMGDIGTLGGSSTTVYGLNNVDMITGASMTASGQTHAFLYSSSGMADLGTLGGNYSYGQALNDAGQVIGISETASNEFHGFLYTGGAMADLGTLGGNSSTPNSINKDGLVVGYSYTTGGVSHAFLYRNGSMVDLNDSLSADSGWVLNSAELINDASQIAGYGTYNGIFQLFFMAMGTENQVPVAFAGPNQTVECPAAVTLDGSASTDPDGDSLTFQWSFHGSVIGTSPTLTVSLPLGTNVVTLTVTDTCGASNAAAVIVYVLDTTPPAVTCPSDVTLNADANCQALVPDFVSGLAVSDNCSAPGTLLVSQIPLAGTPVGLGTQSVLLSVTDASRNTAQCTVHVNVVDHSAPVIVSLPEPITLASGADGQASVPDIRSSVAATDNCTPAANLSIVQNPAPGTLLGAGQYSVVVTVTDAAGNRAAGSVVLVVADLTPPTINSITVNPSDLSPPNHRIVPVTVTVNSSDNGTGGTVSQITSITCNETLSSGEAVITGPLTASLAASRDSSGNGRIYTLTVQCVDSAGNVTIGTVQAVVPKGHSTGGGK